MLDSFLHVIICLNVVRRLASEAVGNTNKVSGITWQNGIVNIQGSEDAIRPETFVLERRSLTNYDECGKSKVSVSSRLVGGQIANVGKWPWQAMVLRFYDGNAKYIIYCGGTLISRQWVLTASQCLDIKAISHNIVALGAHHRNLTSGHAQTVAVGAILCHQESNGTNFVNDICLLKLAVEVTYTNYFLPACLPEAGEETHGGEVCTVTGWGDTTGTEDKNVLRESRVNIVTNSQCKPFFSSYVPTSSFCARTSEGSGPLCFGDGGGPLVCQRGQDENIHYTVFGVASFTARTATKNCTQLQGSLSGFTNVTKYLDWINETQINAPDVSNCFDKSTIRKCGSVISSNNSIIRSPTKNYLNWIYPPNESCKWKIVAPLGYVLRFKFLCFLSMENIGSVGNSCGSDNLRIDAVEEFSVTYCGSHYIDNVDEYETKGNIANVSFYSNSDGEAQGFVFQVTFIKKYGNEPMCFDKSTIRNCGETIDADNTIIRSPTVDYESWMYPASTDCIWPIRAPTGSRLRFEFLCFMNIDARQSTGNLCNDDYLKIESPNGQSKLYCGFKDINTMAAYETDGNEANLIFSSDSRFSAQGFVVRVTFVKQFETPVITVPSASFQLTTAGSQEINCSATGNPNPFVVWKRGNETTPTLTSAGVYQKMDGASAVLKLENAKVIHEGEYSCVATNTYGARTFQESKTVMVTVPSQPNIVHIESYPCNSTVKVQWTSHDLGVGIPHRIMITTSKGVAYRSIDSPRDQSLQTNTITNLTSSTAYNVTINPCQSPDCGSSYMAIVIAGQSQLPTYVRLVKIYDVCRVYWTPPTTDQSSVTGFNVTTKFTIANVPVGSKKTTEEEFKILSENLFSYEIPKRPNTNHTVTVEALSCSNSSEKVTAKGECITSAGVPTSLPTLKSASGVNDGKMFITLRPVNERNGLVSCLLIIINVGESRNNEDVWKLLNGSISEESRETYLAITMPPTRGVNKLIIAIGDDTTSSCHIRQKNKRRKRQIGTNGVVVGRNLPLKDSLVYKIYLVTATPSEGDVLFKVNEPLLVGQQFQSNLTYIILVAAAAALIAIGVVIFMRMKQKQKRKKMSVDDIGETNAQRMKTFHDRPPLSLPRKSFSEDESRYVSINSIVLRPGQVSTSGTNGSDQSGNLTMNEFTEKRFNGEEMENPYEEPMKIGPLKEQEECTPSI